MVMGKDSGAGRLGRGGESAKDHLTREMQLAQPQNAKGEQEVWPRLDLD